ncbi:hypothetical protein OP10G_0783 [Fimbriimonas ginsengisoli Gsoil 348]|uniref:Uncharacterized protein n=1 Tax=Fimbriimonas ginsengisoli Gsoil 348 TaxID=661478 RepID=A0A068NL00_FIMGI|nr:hypothetical protein OP10G_0783 [Fimbriimonas ginsengisoli Gsoil 348]
MDFLNLGFLVVGEAERLLNFRIENRLISSDLDPNLFEPLHLICVKDRLERLFLRGAPLGKDGRVHRRTIAALATAADGSTTDARAAASNRAGSATGSGAAVGAVTALWAKFGELGLLIVGHCQIGLNVRPESELSERGGAIASATALAIATLATAALRKACSDERGSAKSDR